MFDNDTELLDEGEGFSLEFEEPVVEEPIISPPELPKLGEEPKPEVVSKAEFDKINDALAEMRGRLAAMSERPVAPAQREPEPVKPDNSAAEAQLRTRLRAISQKMYDPDTSAEGLEEFLGLTAQIAAAQSQQITQQYAGSAVTTAVDLMIENFMAKQAKKDDLYDEVEPLVEAELAKYDKAAIAKMSRADLMPALEKVYKAAKADVLEKKWNEGKRRAAERKAANPPSFGGKTPGSAPVGGGRPTGKALTEGQKKFALDAGLSEEDLDGLFGNEEESEW